MNALIQRSLQTVAALPPARRYLLLGGWVVVLTLLLVLLGRPLAEKVKQVSQWPGLARQAQTLGAGPAFSSDYWQALTSARGVVLTRVEQRGDIWLLRGELTGAQPLAQLMRSIQDQGGQPLRWSLEQGQQAMLFSLDVSAAGGRP
jgi:type II secretion system protein M (XcpZ-type)